MQLLDSTLAFALTMAALATVVTVIMEACLRIARMRKKNLIEVMKLLNQVLAKGKLGMTKEERWEFFVRVVENPAEATIEKVKSKWEKLSIEERIAFFGRDKSAGVFAPKRIINFLSQIFGDQKRSGLYENVSLEYMLRCLAETRSIKKASLHSSEKIKTEFNRIARKYEEFGSSVSASFKHHAQAWSIGIGIVLAMVVNIDGLRIFESYRLDPGLAAVVIQQQEELTETHKKAQDSIDKLNEIQSKVAEAKSSLLLAEKNNKKGAEIEKKKQTLAEAEAALAEQTNINKIQQTIQSAQQQVANLSTLGMPIGWDLYPNCPFGGDEQEWATSSPQCRAIPVKVRGFDGDWIFYRVAYTAFSDFRGFIFWLFVVVTTGVLIGLGAPFWFDVAKRLSLIRKGLQSAAASAEYRLSGSDANGKYKKRKEIVKNVLTDAAADAAADAAGDAAADAAADAAGDAAGVNSAKKHV